MLATRGSLITRISIMAGWEEDHTDDDNTISADAPVQDYQSVMDQDFYPWYEK